jgi:hypothetical protein
MSQALYRSRSILIAALICRNLPPNPLTNPLLTPITQFLISLGGVLGDRAKPLHLLFRPILHPNARMKEPTFLRVLPIVLNGGKLGVLRTGNPSVKWPCGRYG